MGGVVSISSPSYTLNKQQPPADSIRDLLIPQEVTIRPFKGHVFHQGAKRFRIAEFGGHMERTKLLERTFEHGQKTVEKHDGYNTNASNHLYPNTQLV